MSRPAASDRVEAAVVEAVERHGLRPLRLVPVSLFQGEKGGRHAFLVECEDGLRLKARFLVREEEARLLCELREGIEPAFAPVLSRHGEVLVEEWVEGSDVGEEKAERVAAEAGALLGRLHARRLSAGSEEERATAGYVETARSDLEILAGAGALAPAEASSLEARLEEGDPGRYSAALIHRDFCPENFVIAVEGSLFVIDNEWFAIGSPGFDLGRTYHRWDISDPAWCRFLDGYETAAEIPEALEFWTIASTLFGARAMLRLMPIRLDPLLAILRGIGGRPLDPRPR